MIPTNAEVEKLHRRYAQNDVVFNLVYGHCQIVAEIAKWCVEQNQLEVNREILEAGCLLHDIGTYALFDAKGLNDNQHNYKQHAILSAALVLEEGFDIRIADMVRTHVLMGLTKEEVITNNFGIPQKDYLPATLEARLLCYADRFHSKQPTFNAYEPFLKRLSKDLPEQAIKLQAAAAEFGIPDVQALAEKYGHPIRN
jgi:uncharacterized protein